MELVNLFVQVLAQAMKLVKLEQISLDGAKSVLSEAEGIKANAIKTQGVALRSHQKTGSATMWTPPVEKGGGCQSGGIGRND